MLTHPELTDKHLNTLIAKLGISAAPLLLRVLPDSDAVFKECFINVANKIGKQGGKILFGWQVWKQAYILEAEFHAVWQDDEGNLLDITPQATSSTTTLFIMDDNRTFNKQQVDNVRINITDNRLVDDYIALAEARFRIENRGERANQTGIISFSSQQEKQQYAGINNLMVGIEKMLDSGQSRNSPCLCGSNQKFKQCHGKELIFQLQKIQ